MAMLKIVTNDGKTFEVAKDVISLSGLIKTMVADLDITEGDDQDPIPLSEVSGAIFEKVIEWCKQHKNDPPIVKDDAEQKIVEMTAWDVDFFEKLNQEELTELITAANYLDIEGLLDMGCKTFADMIKGKSVEEIRKHFNIQNDLPAEEEEKIKKENAWTED